MLTRRGWSFVGAAVGLYVGGRLLGLVQLAVLAVATALLARRRVRVGPAARPRRSSRRRDAEGAAAGRRRGPRRPRRRRRRRRARRSRSSDAFDQGRRAARFLLAPLGAGRRGAGRVPVPHRPAGPLRDRPAARDADRSVRARRRRAGACSAPNRSSSTRACTTSSPPPDVGGLDLDRDHPAVRARVETERRLHDAARVRAGRRPAPRALAVDRPARAPDDAPERDRAGARRCC